MNLPAILKQKCELPPRIEFEISLKRSQLISLFVTLVFWSWWCAEKAHGATATAQIGQNVTLSVSADGTAPFSYRWLKNGATIDGATAADYALISVKQSDSGAYTSVVSNSAGSAISDTATLTISPMLATLTATVTSINYPQPTLYQWRLNGRSILGANQPTYTFDPALAPGSYSLTITYPNPPPLK